jgi:hypothetical protein
MGVTSILPSSQVQAAKVKKLTVKTKKITLYKGAAAGYGSTKLKVTVKPKKAKVSYKVSNKKVATVTKKGLVKAKKVGKTKVVVKAGSKKVTVKVVVKKIKKKVTKVTATKNITVAVGGKQKIKTSVKPAKATLKKLTFTTKNNKIATVTAKGVVKGVAEGNAKVVVKAVDGSKKKATVAVVVSGGAVSTATTAPAVSASASASAVTSNAPAASADASQPSAQAPETSADAAQPSVEPSAPADGTQPSAPADDTKPSAPADDTQPSAPVDDTQPSAPADDTQPSAPADDTQQTEAPVKTTTNPDGTTSLTTNIKDRTFVTSGTGIEISAATLKVLTTVTNIISSSKSATGAAASFKNSGTVSGGGISITKEEGATTAAIKVSETKSYTLSLQTTKKTDENGQETEEETGEISLAVQNPDTNSNSLSLNATTNEDGNYTVTDLTVGDTKASGTYEAKVADADGTQTITMTNPNNAANSFSIAYTEETGDLKIDAPQEYLDKYGLSDLTESK